MIIKTLEEKLRAEGQRQCYLHVEAVFERLRTACPSVVNTMTLVSVDGGPTIHTIKLFKALKKQAYDGMKEEWAQREVDEFIKKVESLHSDIDQLLGELGK